MKKCRDCLYCEIKINKDPCAECIMTDGMKYFILEPEKHIQPD